MNKTSMVLVSILCVAMTLAAQNHSKSGGKVDKAYAQTIWDGWAALDAAKQKQFYAQGPHTFFDIAPLKYNSWDEYQSGVTQELGDYSAATFKVNDDFQVHQAGAQQWTTATVAFDMTHKSGKHDAGQMRWTAIFEKQAGRWLIVHEHVSVPMQ